MKAEKKLELEAELGRIIIKSIKHRDALAELQKQSDKITLVLSKE